MNFKDGTSGDWDIISLYEIANNRLNIWHTFWYTRPTYMPFCCRIVPESPRWLISKGRYEEANKIVQKCAKVNGVTLPENAIDKDSEENTEKMSVLKMLTVPRLLIRTLIIYLNW